MDKPQPFWRFLLEISAIVAFVVVMYVVFEFFNARIRPMASPEARETAPTPILGSGEPVQIEAESSPYPPPYPLTTNEPEKWRLGLLALTASHPWV